MSYSLDFRIRVIKISKERCLSVRETSTLFKIGNTTLMRWRKRIEPLKKRNKPATKIDMKKLSEDVEKYPDSFLHERAVRLGVSKGGIYDALKRLSVTYKKNFNASQSERKGSYYFS